MNIFDQNIVNISESIDKNISLLADDERGVLSQNILANARNLLEAISLRIYSEIDDTIMHYNYNDIGKANEYVASRGEFSCIYKFHQLLQRSVSHYTPNEDNAIRLMMKYYEYFLRIKSFVKDKFDLDILNNIEDFPLNKDESLKEYYEKIALKVESINESSEKLKDRFYIQKTKPI